MTTNQPLFSIVEVVETYKRANRTQYLTSRKQTTIAAGCDWDRANDIMEQALPVTTTTRSGFVSTARYIIDADAVLFANPADLNDRPTLPCYGPRADGWSMRDNRPQRKCAKCGTWGDHNTMCCV